MKYNSGGEAFIGVSVSKENFLWPTSLLSGNCDVRSYGGNGGGACCVFPFTYKGKVYNKCTEDDEELGLAWCSVTSDYERDRKRGHCVSENGEWSSFSLCIYLTHD